MPHCRRHVLEWWPALPEDVIGDYAEPDEQALRGAD